MNDKKGEEKDQSRPLIEWVFGIVSAVLVSGLIAFLAYEASFGDSGPPDLRVSVEKVEQVSGGMLVMIEVTNEGSTAAAEVRVAARRTGLDGTEAVKEIFFDYVSPKGARKGAFFFEGEDFDAGEVGLSIHGFVEP